MHPSISLMLNNPRMRASLEQGLARRGQGGDSMIAHINPAEALALKRMGGSGTINPRTGLRQFWEDGGGAGNSAGAASGNQGGGGFGGGGNSGGNGGYNGQGRGFSGPAGGTVAGPYGGHLGGPYGTTGGMNINPDRAVGGLIGSALGPLGGILGSLVGGWASDQLGGNFNIGGTDNRISAGMGIGGSSSGWGAGWGSGTGSGLHDGVEGRMNDGGPRGGPGTPGAPQSSPGTQPASAAMPAGMPPVSDPTLAGLYYAGMNGDPFAGRFGINPGLLAYLIAANQPQGGGFPSGMAR